MNEEARIDRLLKACIYLKGDMSGNKDAYECGHSLCKRCGGAVPTEGQEALQSLATAEGIWFRCKVPCRCGGTLGFVSIDKEA